MQKVDTFTVQNKKTWFDANSRRQLTKLTHPSYLKQNAITTQKLVVSKFTRLRKKEKVKASSKWLGLSLILTIKNRNLQNCKLQLCFLSLSSAKASFQSSLTSVQTLSLSGCLIHLGSHPTANQTESFIFSNLSCPSLSSFSPHPLTDLSYQILSCSTQPPALQLTD